MDQPTSIAAIVVGLAAGVIATAVSPVAREAVGAESTVAPMAASAASANCVRRAPGPNIAPTVTPPRPPDMQADADGLNRAGGIGSLPSDNRGDPCAAVVRPGQAARLRSAPASAPR